jgi:hypothetical protein
MLVCIILGCILMLGAFVSLLAPIAYVQLCYLFRLCGSLLCHVLMNESIRTRALIYLRIKLNGQIQVLATRPRIVRIRV